MPDLLTGDETFVYEDSDCVEGDKRGNAVVKNKCGKKIQYKINKRPSQMRKLSKDEQYRAKKIEHQKSSIRAKVEHVFGVVKKLFKHPKTRYQKNEKQTQKMDMIFALANLYLADKKTKLA